MDQGDATAYVLAKAVQGVTMECAQRGNTPAETVEAVEGLMRAAEKAGLIGDNNEETTP